MTWCTNFGIAGCSGQPTVCVDLFFYYDTSSGPFARRFLGVILLVLMVKHLALTEPRIPVARHVGSI